MTTDDKNADQLISIWVASLLKNPNQLLALPLGKDLKSPWNINVMADFLSNEVSISFDKARLRRHLTLPLIEKMDEMKVVVKGASTTENLFRQRILYWYSTLNFEDKKCLPRLTKSPNNICFASIGPEQKSWLSYGVKYELIGKTIDEIHVDLHQLGIIEEEFKPFNARKRPIKDTKSAILEWVSNVLDDTELLWEIPLKKSATPLGFNVAVEHIQRVTGISTCSATKYRELALPVIEKMIKEKILIIPNEPYEAASIEEQRKLRNWDRKLSIEEKKLLPIFGNRISLKRIPAEQRPIHKNSLKFAAVKSAWNLIHEDLESLGIINKEYKSVAEREAEKLIYQQEPNEYQTERFNRLATNKLNAATDFFEPSKLEPFIQVEQLFAVQSKTVASESGKSNYRNACHLFIEFLSESYGTKPLRITAVFDEHLFSRFRKYLEQKIISKEISSHHANTILSSVRKALQRLTQVSDMGYSFFDANGFDKNRETDIKKPFSKNERLQILAVIEKGLEASRAILAPYKKANIGTNPLDKNGARIKGLSTLENARWLFENPLKCKPIHYNTANSPTEKSFLKIIADSNKGLLEVYKEWGVLPMVSVEILIPYLLRLAQITALNTNSLIALDIDDYVENHPATSRPCLRYWKERSNGHKEYHLDLFNAELSWLTSTQAKAVKEVFQEVIQITSSLRHDIEDDALKNRLFIYQSNSTKKHGRVSPIFGNEEKNEKSLGDNLARFVEKYNLKNDQGEPLTLTISRFRPTFVSEMLDSGVSLREIQLMLGHSTIRTTISYLDSLDFNSISRVKINDALKEIHQSTLNEETQAKDLIQIVEHTNAKKLATTFHTPLAECKNIFDPPEFVKKLSSYIPGTPCSQYNKCLSCDNVIITAKNLPEIFAMQRDYTLLTEHTRVMDTPYGHVIRENLELIKNITDPQLSDFSVEELQDGQRLSEYIETTTLVDGAV